MHLQIKEPGVSNEAGCKTRMNWKIVNNNSDNDDYDYKGDNYDDKKHLDGYLLRRHQTLR